MTSTDPSVDMGADASACLWDATSKACVSWCIEHADLWSKLVLRVLDSTPDNTVPTRLHLPVSMDASNGASPALSFAKNDKAMPIVGLDVIVIAVGIDSSDSEPGAAELDSWENTFQTSLPLVCISATSYGSKPDRYWSVQDTTKTACKNMTPKPVSGAELASQMTAFMQNPKIANPRVLFVYRANLGCWDAAKTAAVCNALDTPINPLTMAPLYPATSDSTGRTYILRDAYTNPAATVSATDRGVHLVMDIAGVSKQPEWHTALKCLLEIPTPGSDAPSVCDVVFSW
jgi:hypothetical protein